MKDLNERIARLTPVQREYLASRVRAGAAPDVIPRRQPGDDQVSFVQEQLWAAHQLEPDSARYNVHQAFQLDGPLDVGVFTAAWDLVCRRHDILRSTVLARLGKPAVSAVRLERVPIARFDLTGGDERDRDRRCADVLARYAHAPFDLAAGPLVRLALAQLSGQRHVLLLAAHHIIFDAASIALVLDDLSTHYAALIEGGRPDAPRSAIDYADFAAWQRTRLRGAHLERLTTYWERTLDAAPAPVGLAGDRPPSSASSDRGATTAIIFEPALGAALLEVCRRNAITPFMLLLAAFGVILWRYTGCRDLIVGTPSSGRDRAELEPVIGPLLNTLALRLDLAGDPTFLDLAARVREMVLEAYAHQELPIQLLTDRLKARQGSRAALFDVMFAHQQLTTPATIAGCRATRFGVPRHTALFDLELTTIENNGALKCVAEYRCDTFEAATIERFLKRYERLLDAIAAAPGQRLSALHLLAPAERQQLLVAWNRTASTCSSEQTIHHLFERQAARTPDATAVIGSGGRLSYRQLNERANQVAHTLMRRGIGRQDVVAIRMPRSPGMIVALLGVLKAGAAYAPIDPEYPGSRVEFILQDTMAKAVLTPPRQDAESPHGDVPGIAVDRDGVLAHDANTADPAPRGGSRDAAYVIYTSGSSGVPKGVVIEHRSLVNFAEAAASLYQIDTRDRVLQFASLTFDTSAEEIYPALITGATLVLRGDAPETIVDFLGTCSRHGITILDLPTAYWHEMVVECASRRIEWPSAIRVVIIGGEQARPDDVAQWLRGSAKQARLFNTYGPTEATVISTIHELTDETAPRAPIGRPIPHARVYVLDERMEPVPPGVPGELWIGGVGLARGYLARPALTAECFWPDPFGVEPGGRLYRTRDLVRWSDAGELEFLGRADNQVKVRGYRIELGEIEQAVLKQPAVRQAAVLVEEGPRGERRLTAYVELSADAPDAALADVRAGVLQSLPLYMCPTAWRRLTTLPKSTSGKVDRRVLASLAPAEWREIDRTPPRTAVERRLAEIWASVLGREEIGVDENFFDVGGDSILGIQIAARAREAGLYVTPKQLLTQQTIEALAAVVSSAPPPDVRDDEDGRTGSAPLTSIQHWFFDQRIPNRSHFNQAFLFEAPADVQADLLQNALHLVVEHHEALRLRFTETPSGWIQSVGARERTDLTVCDLAGASEEQFQEALAAAQRSLDIERGPVFRAVLFDLGARGRRLLLAVHHLVIDGVSWRILLEDLTACYRLLSAAEPVRLPSKTTSYAAWARALQQHAAADAVAREASYWIAEERRHGEPLYVDRENGWGTVDEERHVVRWLDEEASRDLLTEAPRTYNTRIMDLLCAALIRALHDWRGVRTLRVDLEGHGREALLDGVDLTRTIGWFTSIYPVVLEWRDAEAMGSLIKRVKEQLRAIPSNGAAYGVLRYLRPGSGIARVRPGELTFNYLGQFDGAAGRGALFPIASEGIGASVDPEAIRSSKLDVNAMVIGGRLRMTWSFSETLHERGTVAALAMAFESSLREILAHCLAPGEGGYTPADFAGSGLSQASLDDLLAQIADQAD